MVLIYNRNGQVVSQSKNLRGILDYTRKHPLRNVFASELPKGRGHLRLIWNHGEICNTEFESFTALLTWLESRKSWNGVRYIITTGAGTCTDSGTLGDKGMSDRIREYWGSPR